MADMEHLRAELHDPRTRRQLALWLRDFADAGYQDPELLYLGGRYAASLAMPTLARRFLEPLAAMLIGEGDDPSPAYAPVGLLLLQVAEDAEMTQKATAQLEKLEPQVPGITLLAAALAGEPGEDGLGGTAAHLLRRLSEHPPDRAPPWLDGDLRQHLDAARQADEAYLDDELETARTCLEGLLAGNGDQPDVLHDLLTVAGEQGDVEAYERYWRRYVNILLWRILRDDDGEDAWDRLIRFYAKVARITDGAVTGTPGQLSKVLTQRGFLERWLESHAALVWLDALRRGSWHYQTGLDADQPEDGQIGYSALQRFWLALFCPAFAPYARPPQRPPRTHDRVGPVIEEGYKADLPFDPSERLARRYLEWSSREVQWGLHVCDDEHHRAVLQAMAGCVARLPTAPLLSHLGEAMGDKLRGKPVGQALQEACSLPFHMGLGPFFQGEDFGGMARWLGDPDLHSSVSPDIRICCALGLARSDREEEGLELALSTLGEWKAEDLEEGKQNHQLWLGVLHGYIHKTVEGGDAGAGDTLDALTDRLLTHKGQGGDLDKFVEQLLGVVEEVRDQFVTKGLIDNAIQRSKELVEQGHFAAAKKLIRDLPDRPDQVRDLKVSLLEQIGQAEEHAKMQKKIEAAIEKSKELVGEEKFGAARRVVRRLPDEPDQLRDLKASLLEQIGQAEKQSKLHEEVDRAVKRSQELASKGKFAEARRVVRSLPDSPEDLRKLKRNLLGQIDEAEQHSKLHGQIEEAIEEAKRQASMGMFSSARSTIRKLPDSPAEVSKLKRDFLAQIDEAERQQREGSLMKSVVESAIKKSKEQIGKGDFSGARSTVQGLPDSPSDLRELKRNLLEQIDEVERSMPSQSDVSDLMNKLTSRGIPMEAIAHIASENNVDLTNTAEFYALLQAIDKQL